MRKFATPSAAYYEICREVEGYGDLVAPRGLRTRELLHYTFKIMNPLADRITRPGYNTAFAAAEAVQLIGGFSDPEMMLRINPTMGRFMSAEGSPPVAYQHGAYGPRMAGNLEKVVETLTNDPDSRQAAVNIFDAHQDYVDQPDLPCTLSVQFMIRRGHLNAHVTMRSNDVWWGLPYDIFQFTQLQATVANLLDLPIGHYFHTAHSMHAYEPHWDDIQRLTISSVTHPNDFVPDGLPGSSVAKVRALARVLSAPDWEPSGETSRWYHHHLQYVSPRA